MYHNAYTPDVSNNPFINDPTNPQSRFPDLSRISSPPAQQWYQAPSDANYVGYQAPPMYQQPTNQGYPTNYLTPGSLSPGLVQQPTGAPFRPTSTFGQQLAANISGSSYGYLQGQPTGQQQNVYHPAQQQLQNNPGYIAQFDPYASLGQAWDNPRQPSIQSQATQNPSSSSIGTITTSTSPSGVPHPREYLRTHKAEVEAWDNYAWKQLLNSFDFLKQAWEGHTKELEGRIGQLQAQLHGAMYPGQIQQEGGRLQGVCFFHAFC